MNFRNLFFGTGTASPTVDLGLLLLRLAFGIAITLGHGLSKVSRYPDLTTRFSDPLGIGSSTSLFFATFAEVAGGILLALGLFGRLAAAMLAFTMAVAFFLHHGADPFPRKELAFTYFCAFLALMVSGPGRFSIDRLIRK
jgi:putative oxidoreductase